MDILVSNAGIASSAPVEETTLELWNKNMDILSTGYFLVSREAFRLVPSAEHRRFDHLRRVEERPGGKPQCFCLLHGQGCGNPSRALSCP
jgi:NAD(P)-dependent dehydrogenase (short-subunit alcohol dehydrogenase family)